MNKILLSTILAMALAASAVHAAADDDNPKKGAIKYRKAVMTLVGANFKPMGAMMKGEAPFDAAVFARHAQDLAAVSHVDVLRGFPEDSEGEGSKAKGEIWLDWTDFKNKLSDMQQQTLTLAKVAQNSDQAAIKAQFGKTAKTCKACHKQYKE